MKITIVKDGPYIVTGGVPIKEVFIVPHGHHMEMEPGRELPQADEYHLCRCGKSQNKPFCDGSHQKSHFHAKDTASTKPYNERVEDITEGTKIKLLDDGRCAFARFCHTEKGDIWSLVQQDDDENLKELAIKTANKCPAGRLVMVDKEGNVLEENQIEEIIILQDPAENASAAIYVKGNIPIVSADNEEYEKRNRVTLCRCGKSRNKPFCDATHVSIEFNDGHLE